MARALRPVLAVAGLGGVLAWLWRWWPSCCDPGVGAWASAPEWAASGAMTNVAAFNDFVADSAPCWRHHPVGAALAIIGIDPASDAPTTPLQVTRAPSAGSGEVEVTLVDEQEDDSVAATRHRFTFVDEGVIGGDDGVFRLVQGLREVRCQPGRGHEDWGPTPCV